MAHHTTQTFKDEQAPIERFNALAYLRKAGKLTDLTIELQGNAKLHAHRVVFASCVPSLCDTLCKKPTKGQTVVLQWPTISTEVASPLIDYFYTGRLIVNEANAFGLIMLSQELAIRQVEAWSVSFMAARLNSENIANNWELAQLLKSDSLKNACLNYMKATFEATIASDFFIQLPADAVLSLLRADDLHVDSEETVLKAIGCWINPPGKVDKGRLQHAEAMMKEVRWDEVDNEFRCDLQDDDEGFWNKNLKCSRLLGRISNWIAYPDWRMNRKCPFNNARRNPLGKICLLGRSATGGQYWLTRYDAESNTSRKLIDIPARSDVNFVVIKNCIFFIGGMTQDVNYTSVDKFDTREHRWAECAPLAGWYSTHAAVAVPVGEDTVICVCGGRKNKYNSLGECALYSPQEDKWYELPSLKRQRRCAATVALSDGRVFVIGGNVINLLNDYSLSSVETCHLREPAHWQGELKASNVFWQDAADMLEPRAEHAAVAFRDRIFIAGGRNNQGFMNTVDVFTPPDNQRPLGQWTRLATWSTGRPTAALVVCEDRLFCFKQNEETRCTLVEFVPPENALMLSCGNFGLWRWVNRRGVWNLKDVQRAFFLP